MKTNTVNADVWLLEQQEHRSSAPPSRWLKVNAIMQMLHVAVLLALVVMVGIAYHNVNHQLEPFRHAATNPKAPTFVSNFLSQVASTFFFGASDGSVAVFLQNSILSYDFASLASAVGPFAGSASTALQDYGKPSTCYNLSTVSCSSSYSLVYCPDGSYAGYCYSTSQQFTCGKDTCFAPEMAKILSIIQSVSNKVSTMPKVNSVGKGTEAMSNGVFRLDTLLDWAKVQANGGAWKSAGEACNALKMNVGNLDWAGSFNESGVVRQYNSTADVIGILNLIDQVCTPLSNMTVV